MKVESSKSERACLLALLKMARDEDLGPGDVTSAMLPEDAEVRGSFVARQELVFCGGVFLSDVAEAYDKGISTAVKVGDGDAVKAGAALGEWAGNARAILAAERVALNFLQRLSGIATLTRKYVDAVGATGADIFDTRKTAPGWRALEKYAVRVSGGRNHRMGLYDAVLVKDNHLAALSKGGRREAIASLAGKLDAARSRLGGKGFVELEVDTLDVLAAALKLPVDVIMLDNMSPDELRRAVAMRNEAGLSSKVALEASGGVTLENVRAVAETGVERIAVGALTHSAAAPDIALEIELI